MKLWWCIQFDPGYDMGYFSTSGRELKTGSWLFCHETDYISVSNFTVSYQKVISSRLGHLPIQLKPEILVKTGSFPKIEFMTSHMQLTYHMTANFIADSLLLKFLKFAHANFSNRFFAWAELTEFISSKWIKSQFQISLKADQKSVYDELESCDH